MRPVAVVLASALLIGARANVVWVAGPNTPAALYVVDSFNHALRRIEVAGNVTVKTVAGDGQPGHVDGIGTAARFHQPRGITAARKARRLYIADENNGVIRTVTCPNVLRECRVGTIKASDATFADPEGVLAVGRMLYVADTRNGAVRRISLASSAVETIADSKHSDGRLRDPSGLASDGTHLFVTDISAHAIHRLRL